MAKSEQNPDNASQVPPQAPPPPDRSQQAQQAYPVQQAQEALVKALTEAFNSVRRDGPLPSDLAKSAVIQYGEIKGALRTFFEKQAPQGQSHV
jgi:hypothetical protein